MIHNWLNAHTQKGLIVELCQPGRVSLMLYYRTLVGSYSRQHFIHNISEDMTCIAKAESQCKGGVQKILTGWNNGRNLRGTLWRMNSMLRKWARCLPRSFYFWNSVVLFPKNIGPPLPQFSNLKLVYSAISYIKAPSIPETVGNFFPLFVYSFLLPFPSLTEK